MIDAVVLKGMEKEDTMGEGVYILECRACSHIFHRKTNGSKGCPECGNSHVVIHAIPDQTEGLQKNIHLVHILQCRDCKAVTDFNPWFSVDRLAIKPLKVSNIWQCTECRSTDLEKVGVYDYDADENPIL